MERTRTPGPPAGIAIRRARAEEWEALRDLRLHSLRADPLAFGSTLAIEAEYVQDRWRERALRGSRAPDSSTWVAATEGGRLVGMLVTSVIEGSVHLFAMWVDPAFRQKGVGGALLDRALTWVSEDHRGRRILLEVNPRQVHAMRLYESRGFRSTGVVRPLGHTPREVVMEMERGPPTAPKSR